MKTCFKCQAVKPLDQFYRHSEMADGYHLLITGTGSNHTRIDSNLDRAAREMLLEWCRSGTFEGILTEHYRKNPQPDAPLD